MNSDTPADVVAEMVAGCHMARARVVTRHLAHLYDEALRPFGLQASQFHLLVAIAFMGPVRRSTLGQVLRLEPSTLTRNLRVMLANGWIAEQADAADARARLVRASEAGRDLLERLAPAWRGSQARARAFLGAEADAALRALADGLMAAAAGDA